MSLQELLGRLLTRPSPSDLLALQTVLLAAQGEPQRSAAARDALALAHEFYTYLSEIEAKVSARNYSELASKLDMGAVGAVALQNLAEAGEAMLKQVLLGGISEILMVIASRQYVKAWSREMRPVHLRAAWFLRGELWQLSVRGRPDLSAEQRAALVDGLLTPILEGESEDMCIALLGRLFQVLLIIYLAQALAT